MMVVEEVCGMVSSVLISVMFVPQVIHTCRTKDTEGFSYAFLCTNLVASVLGMVYSAHFIVIPMLIANTSASLFSLFILWIKSASSKHSVTLESL